MTNYAGRVLMHGGGAAAYRSFAAHFVDQSISIAVLCNAGEASDARDDFVGYMFDLFMADKGLKRPASTPPPAGVTGVDVTPRAGLFFNERTNEPLRLVANNGRLAMVPGGPLVTVAADRFKVARPSTSVLSNDDFELVFLSNDQLELKSMEGTTTRYRRSRPYSPTADDLKAFAGRYQSDELRATFNVSAGKAGLMLVLNDRPVIEFGPVDPDTFQRGAQTVRFERGKDGKVVALVLTNPAIRNIRFPLTSEGARGRLQ
jgi:hypothetical protein